MKTPTYSRYKMSVSFHVNDKAEFDHWHALLTKEGFDVEFHPTSRGTMTMVRFYREDADRIRTLVPKRKHWNWN